MRDMINVVQGTKGLAECIVTNPLFLLLPILFIWLLMHVLVMYFILLAHWGCTLLSTSLSPIHFLTKHCFQYVYKPVLTIVLPLDYSYCFLNNLLSIVFLKISQIINLYLSSSERDFFWEVNNCKVYYINFWVITTAHKTWVSPMYQVFFATSCFTSHYLTSFFLFFSCYFDITFTPPIDLSPFLNLSRGLSIQSSFGYVTNHFCHQNQGGHYFFGWPSPPPQTLSS